MTSLIEKAISIIAPHRCLVCSKENNVLCVACANDSFMRDESSCGFCDLPTANHTLCRACRSKSAIQHIWIAGRYKGVIADLIRRFKFQSLRSAAEPLAAGMAEALPTLEPATIIVPVPTAPQRIRIRGYDQTELLARELCRQTGLKQHNLLRRNHSLRQLGMGRRERQQQAKTAFAPLSPRACAGTRILLIDDVLTTGATVNAAAAILREAGAVSIDVVVIAKQAALKNDT